VQNIIDISNALISPKALSFGREANELVKLGKACYLRGQNVAFSAVDLMSSNARKTIDIALLKELAKEHAKTDELETRLSVFAKPVVDFAGFDLSTPLIMGIVNFTPDSFSDGGDYNNLSDAVSRAISMVEAGAKIIDIGGESTRPGAAKVSVEEEIKRTIPLIAELANRGIKTSIDTRYALVMEEALKHGANVINDINALRDEGALEVASKYDVPVILMHMQGTPDNMQKNPHYDNVCAEVYAFLADRVKACKQAGIKRNNLCIDLGIGFGKNLEHNIELISNHGLFAEFGLPMLLGVSRKSYISHICGDVAPKERVAGSLASLIPAWDLGVDIVRVHDVKETMQAMQVWHKLRFA